MGESIMVKALLYFSPTGSTKNINDYYQSHLQFDYCYDLCCDENIFKPYYDLIVVSFPI